MYSDTTNACDLKSQRHHPQSALYIYIYIYIYIFIRHEDRKKRKKEQLSITKIIQYMITHKQKQNYVRHFDLNTSRIMYFSELTGSLSGILVS